MSATTPMDYEAIARFLFDRLDDIDTLADAIKHEPEAYREAVLKVAYRRFEVGRPEGEYAERIQWIAPPAP